MFSVLQPLPCVSRRALCEDEVSRVHGWTAGVLSPLVPQLQSSRGGGWGGFFPGRGGIFPLGRYFPGTTGAAETSLTSRRDRQVGRLAILEKDVSRICYILKFLHLHDQVAGTVKSTLS